MAFDNRDSIDFGKERIPKLFRTIFIPTLIGMLADVIFLLTDGIFVGHGIGPDGLACINLVCPAMMLITGLGVMFGMGGSVVAAIHLAKENEKAARINVTQALGASILLSLLVVIILYSFPEKMLSLMGVSQELMAPAKEYFLWFIPTCFFIMIQIVGSFIIRLDGSPKYSMLATVIPSVINIILDFVFIFPCHLGLHGAALATDIGTSVGAIMVLVYMFAMADKLKLYHVKMTLTSLRLTLRNVGYMIKVGFSGFIGEFAISMMILAGNLSFGRYLGDVGIAAYSVICYIYPVVINIYIAVSASAQPIISFNHGAEQEERVGNTFRFSVGFSLAFAAIVALIFTLFSSAIIAVFLERGSETFLLASKGLPLFATGFIFTAFNISSVGYFQSVEKSLQSIILTLMRGFLFIIAAFMLIPKIAGTPGLWLAVPAAEMLTTVFAVILLSRTPLAERHPNSEN
jgi:Na+-driven multidrug efflux pump